MVEKENILKELSVLEEKIMSILETEDPDYNDIVLEVVALLDTIHDEKFFKFLLQKLSEKKLIIIEGLKGLKGELINYNPEDERYSSKSVEIVDNPVIDGASTEESAVETEPTEPVIEEEQKKRGRPKKLFEEKE